MKFQKFNSSQEGINAQEALLDRRYFGKGLNTVADIVETYAPRKSRGGDNTDEQVNNYIKYVSGQLGVDPRHPLNPTVLSTLAAAMRRFETGNR